MKKLTPNKMNESPPPAAPALSAPSGPAPNQTSGIPSSISDVAPSPSPEEGFISKNELARRLRISLRTLDNWRRRGIIPCIKCGHSPLFDWPDVQAHLQQNFRTCRRENQLRRIPVIIMSTGIKRKEDK